MNKKCMGCGALLQSFDSEKDGYVKDINKDLCERCFRIKNYGDYKPVVKDSLEFDLLIDEVNKSKDLVVLVVDLFNFNPSFDLFDKLSNDILLVLTKRDILPKSIFDERLLNYIDKQSLNIVDRIIISSNKNYQFDLLLDKINQYKKSNNVYVMGNTNVGKSTMINRILYNYSDSTVSITTSLLPNTTLDKIEIKIDDNLTLIDTPGIVDSGSIYYMLDLKRLKKVVPSKEIRPITYQVHDKQYFMIDDLALLELENNNITFYMANTLDIKRYHKKVGTDLELHSINVFPCEDVVISGMGFIKFTKKGNIKLYTLKGILVYKRKSLI